MTLIRQIEIFLKSSGTSAARFGLMVARDPNLVREMRKGRLPRPRLRQRIIDALQGTQV